jgi:hypothetical protein
LLFSDDPIENSCLFERTTKMVGKPQEENSHTIGCSRRSCEDAPTP